MLDPSRISAPGDHGPASTQPIPRGLGYVAPISDSIARKVLDVSLRAAEQGSATTNVGLQTVMSTRDRAAVRFSATIDQMQALRKLDPQSAALLRRIAADPKVSPQRLRLLTEGITHLGKPYNWGSTGPKQFDCSGFAGYAYKHALGQTIPRTSYFQHREGVSVNRNELVAGDLVFFGKGRTTHVAIYLGDGMMLESGGEGRVATNKGSVRIRPLRADYRGARRFIDDGATGMAKASFGERVYRTLFDIPTVQRIADWMKF
jgi:cell wall-associated NlpC family hydrolase